MANSTGIYQLKNGNWAYRIYMTLENGKKIDTTGRKASDGSILTTKTEAKKAREQRLVELRKNNGIETGNKKSLKLSDIWKEYLDSYSSNKATATVTKYSSLWENHVKHKFGNKRISSITVDDMYKYLVELYKENGYSYKYVESFLKLFYQLFGIAHNMEAIEPERYVRMFVTKGSKLTMPKISQEDESRYLDVKVFTQSEIQQLDTIFKRGNLYTAFLLGYYLGVRVSECFALMWSDINWEEHKITIDKQMNYEDKMFCLTPVKTFASVRIIDIPDVLYEHLKLKFNEYQKVKDNLNYRNNEIVMNKISNNEEKHYPMQGADFINRKENGELLTVNSLKHWNKVIEEETKIDFEYHSLRRTHISMLVAQNVPPKETMKRIGHKKYDTTLKYYTATNDISSTRLISAINSIYIDEKIVTVLLDGQTINVPYHVLQHFIQEYKTETNDETVQKAV